MFVIVYQQHREYREAGDLNGRAVAVTSSPQSLPASTAQQGRTCEPLLLPLKGAVGLYSFKSLPPPSLSLSARDSLINQTVYLPLSLLFPQGG